MNDATETAAPESTTCDDTREITVGESHLRVTCTRNRAHDEDHFDEKAGIGWPNEGISPAGLTQEERVAGVLDRLGVPRGRNGVEWSLTQRTNLFVDRLARRLHTQVENNMIMHNTVKDALTLLVGAPNSSEFRIKTAIAKLRELVPSRRTESGLHLQ